MGLFKTRAERAQEQERREAEREAAKRAEGAAHNAELARKQRVERAKADLDYRIWTDTIPDPHSETLEEGVERALAAMWRREYVDAIRAECLRMARRHAQPGEQVLMIHHQPAGSWPSLTVVVMSGGLIARTRQHSFRILEPVTETTSMFGGVHWMLTAGDRPDFAHALRYQRELVERRAQEESERTAKDARNAARRAARAAAKAAGTGEPAPAAARAPATQPRARGPRPATRLIRTARDAELAAGEWMTYLGYTDVYVTPPGADGGVDVTSTEAYAQVKAETLPTGRPKIQQHLGVCAEAGRQALFFSLAGYTPAAAVFADKVGMALFGFNLACEVEPLNTAARRIFDDA